MNFTDEYFDYEWHKERMEEDEDRFITTYKYVVKMYLAESGEPYTQLYRVMKPIAILRGLDYGDNVEGLTEWGVPSGSSGERSV